MLRRLVMSAAMLLALAACGGADMSTGDTATTEPSAAAAPPAQSEAPASEAPAEQDSDTPSGDARASDFTGVPGVPVAQPGEHPVPEDFPPDYPVPAGGEFEVLDESSVRIDYDSDIDPAALLAFFEEGFVANGWEQTSSNSNKDQFGYDNENRHYAKGEFSATVTVWFPQDAGDPYVLMDVYNPS